MVAVDPLKTSGNDRYRAAYRTALLPLNLRVR